MQTTIELKWERDDNLKVNGTSLQRELPGVTNAMIKRKFGVLPDGCNKHTKYSEQIVVKNNIETPVEGNKIFPTNDPSGIYTLYCFYGEWRIGGHAGSKFYDQLEKYIMSK